MGLIDLKTDLKSLRYGKDTLGGGYSGQPYIQTPIPDSFNDLGAREDFILRGGIGAVRDSLTDIKRLGKMFIDTKSPNGLLFIAKQQLLSRTAVRTQTSGILNEFAYSPLNTLAQAGVVAFGGHLNKQGINPFEYTGAYANNNNLYSTRMKNYNQEWLDSPDGSLKNRLFALYESKIQNNEIGGFAKVNNISSLNGNILSYTGGPGSILGIGNTNIRFTDQRTGDNNALKVSNPNYFTGKYISKNNPDSLKYYKTLTLIGDQSKNNGVSGKYSRLTNKPINNYFNFLGAQIDTYNHNVYQPAIEGNTWPENSPLINSQNTYTYNQKDIIQTENNVGKLTSSPKIQDFRVILRKNSKSNPQSITAESVITAGQLAESLPYSGEGAQNFEQRVKIGDPGQRGNNDYSDYAKGVRNKQNPNAGSAYAPFGTTPGGLDRINSIPIYRSKAVTTEYKDEVNDFVKFRIAVIDNDNPEFKTFMHFRAFLGPISDSYSADWNGFNYLGRGEKFYTYSGFDRKISLSWTVAAQSKEELIPMYKKLNYLASTLAPDYSPKGYMRGNLIQLTIGGYLYEQPGFITGLSYEMGEDSPWEIGIGTTKTPDDSSVKELTQIIRVTGFSFTPIHNFVPRKQQLTFTNNNNTTGSVSDDTGFVQNYDNERFIALSNGISNNYDK
jgi:hypothetical protein